MREKICLYEEDKVDDIRYAETEDVILLIYRPSENVEVTLEMLPNGELSWVMYKAESNRVLTKLLKCRLSWDGSCIECEEEEE